MKIAPLQCVCLALEACGSTKRITTRIIPPLPYLQMPNLMTFDLPFKEHLKFVRQFSSPLKKLWRNLLSSPSHIPLASGFDTLRSLAKLTVSHQSIPSSTLGSSTGPHRAIGDHTKAGIVDTYGPEETFTEGFREYHEVRRG
ncbi:hypothetical protein PM082_002122 [Marasmius tenuissimus]|nr:hypothetical protein PM082_002122 [Marasmius tenuissimus]